MYVNCLQNSNGNIVNGLTTGPNKGAACNYVSTNINATLPLDNLAINKDGLIQNFP